VYYLTVGFLLNGFSFLHAQQSIQYAALSQSVVKNEANYAQNFGTFRTMESLAYEEKTASLAVTVKVIQPICSGQKGSLALVNPSGADWTYKVMSKKGSFVGEGAVGYNRKVGELNPDVYLVQFTLPDGTSAIDEFTIRQPEGIKVSIEKNHTNKYLASNELSFVGISSGANEFVWDFGDGSALQYGHASTTHKYSKPGTYHVKFTANNWDCQESAEEEITISGPVAFDKSEY
jgi:PKD repeat protein